MTAQTAPRRTARRHSQTRAPMIMALEPRLMFDGAAVVDAVQHADAAEAAPAPAAAKEVAFVDKAVAGWESLASGVRDGVEVVYIEAGQSGLEVMAQWAQSHSGYDSIHILSHGADSTLFLGTDTVTSATLADADTAAKLAALGNALSADGDLMLYGCSVAADNSGQTFLDSLAVITGADVAASEDATGAAALGGDWVLERSSGTVETAELTVDDYTSTLAQSALTAGTYDFSSYTSGATVLGTSNATSASWVEGDTPSAGKFAFSAEGSGGTATTIKIQASSGNNCIQFQQTSGTLSSATIASGDNGEFKLTSLTWRNTTSASSSTATFTAYKDGVVVGTTTNQYNGSGTFSTVTFDSSFQNIDKIVITGMDANGLRVDNIVIEAAVIPPTVVTPSAVSVTDTAANDTFSNTTGTLSATADAGKTVASYGISGGGGGGTIDSVTYDVSKAGTYGTLYVKSDTGAYVFVPNATAVNAVSANQSETFTVTATDNVGVVGNATLTVNITGASDTPTLSAPSAASYTDTSAADTFTNTTGTLSGADRDTGASQTYGISTGTAGGSHNIGGIFYDVSKGGTYGTFYVKSSTGQYVYEPNASTINGVTANQSETFTVSVSDGSLSATQTYTVNITGTNDNPALSTPSTVAYTDTSAADTFSNTTGTLSATDADGTIASYGISGGTTGGNTDIGGTTYDISKAGTYGTLYVKSSTGAYVYVPNATALNGVSANQSETFTVTATDNGSASNTATLTVNVTGANDTPVVSTPSAVSVTDTAANDTFSNTTGTLSASDTDGTVASYGISGGTTGGSDSIGGITYDVSRAGTYGTLYVKSSTGEYVFVPNANSVNAVSANQSETFTVTATDNGGGSGNATLTVNVTGANDTPTLSAPSAASYTDTSATDTFSNTTGTLSGADRDTGASQTYGISTGTTGGTTDIGGTIYDVSKAGTYGTLYVKSSTGAYVYVPNASTINGVTANQSETFTVSVSDGSLSATQTYTVNITGANDTPTVSAGGTTGYTEQTPVEVSTAITVGDADADTNWNGGSLTVQITANADSTNDSLSLPTSNPGGSAIWVNTTGNLLMAGSTQIGTITAASVTGGTALVMTFNGNATDALVQSAARVVKFNSDTFNPGTSNRTVTFTAADANAASASATQTVTVTATPDKPTLSGLTSPATATALVENTIQTTPVQIFTAGTIADTDSTHFNGGYLRISGSGSGDQLTVRNQGTGTGQISITGTTVSYEGNTIGTVDATEDGANGGALKINFTTTDATIAATNALLQNIMFSTGDAPAASRTLSVTVQDGTASAVSTAATAVVNVTASNDQPGTISDSNASANSVAENASVGATVGVTASSTDPDGTAVTYSLTDDAGGKFAINSSTGVVTVAAALDYETATSHTITVQASDGTLTRTQNFTISVTNVNENPIFSSGTTATVSESASNGTTVIDVNANDGDGGATDTGLTYTIQSGNTGSVFAINASTGVITVANTLDRETTGSYTLVVRATDGGAAFTDQTITVTISDVNDNTPSITSNGGGGTAAINVAENATAVTTVTATDADASPTLSYSIVGGADSALFAINSSTGALTFASGRDFENPTDQGATAGNNTYVVQVQVSDGTNTASQTITVTITDSDENPAFTSANTVSIQQGGNISLDVNANNGDGGAADAGVTYAFVGADLGLTLNTTTGALSGGSTLAVGTYTVVVRATDGTAHTTDQTITITVTALPDTSSAHSDTTVVAAPTPPPTPPVVVTPPPVVAEVVTVVREPTVTDKPADMQTVVRDTPLTGTGSGGDGGGLGGGFGSLGDGLTTGNGNSFQIGVAPRPPGGGDALIVNAPMRDAVISEGSRISVTVPATAFAHTSSGATVTLSATRSNGASLPGWMNFNPRTGTFEGTPPPGFRGEVVVRVIARDNQGREAVQTFKIVVGQGGGAATPQGGGEGQGQGQPGGGGPGQTGEAPQQRDGKLAQVQPMGRPGLTEQLREQSQQASQAKLAALFGIKQSNVA